MKNNIIKILCIFIFIIILVPNQVKATSSSASSIDDVINNGNSFLNEAKQGEGLDKGDLKEMSKFVSGTLLTIAIGVSLITGAIMGISFITQSIEDKAKIKESITPWVIGIFISFGAYTIWSVTVNIFQTF